MNVEQKSALTALKTCRGQIDGIINMLDEGRYCIDISNQIVAAQAVLKRANRLILSQHIKHCVHTALKDEAQADAKLAELNDIIGTLLS